VYGAEAIKAESGIVSVVSAYVERESLWPAHSQLVVAVSGGADSLCLLGLLLDLRASGHRLAPNALSIAHLDHGIRGIAGEEDARSVAALAALLGIPFFTERIDVVDLAHADRLSLEDAARRARYAFLRRVAADVGADRICLGHTADDQVETIVMHWLRGSGLRGLCGMPASSGDISRPLLCIRHSDTLAYCLQRGWTPAHDETNDDLRYHRNRIRHELLPVLESYNPNLRQTLLRNSELLAGDEAYIRQETDRAYQAVCSAQSDESVTLDLLALRGLPPALSRMVIRRGAEYLARSTPGQVLLAKHIFQLEQLTASASYGAQLHLPGHVMAELRSAALVLRKRPDGGQRPTPANPVQLAVPGECVLPGLGWRLRTSLLDKPPASLGSKRAAKAESIYPLETTVYLDAQAAGNPLWVRTWRSGDRFRPLGMQSEKKLHDYFIDARVPRELRHQIPLVENADHLVWIGGLRLDDRVRITAQTERILVLHIEPV
jgi:tRNA(Ile)-lysidine synthase